MQSQGVELAVAMELGFNGAQPAELSRHGDSPFIEELQQCCSDIELDRECLSDALRTMDELDAVLSWIRKGEDGQHPSNQDICEAMSSVLVVGKNTRAAAAHAMRHEASPVKSDAAVKEEEQSNARMEVQMMQQRVMGLQEELEAAKSEANAARTALAIALEAALQNVNGYDAAGDKLESTLGQWEMQVRELKSELDDKKNEVKDIKARMIMALKALAAHPGGSSSVSLPDCASEQGQPSGDYNAAAKETDVDGKEDPQSSNRSLNMVSWLADSDTLTIVDEAPTAKYLQGPTTEPDTGSPDQSRSKEDQTPMKQPTRSPPTTPYGSPAGWSQARSPEDKAFRGYKPPVGMTYIEMLEELAAPYSHLQQLQQELEMDMAPVDIKSVSSRRVEEHQDSVVDAAAQGHQDSVVDAAAQGHQDSVVDAAQGQQPPLARAHEEQHHQLPDDDGVSGSHQLETAASPVGDAGMDENGTPQATETNEDAPTQQHSGNEVPQQGPGNVDSTPQECTGSTLEDMVQEYLRQQKDERSAGNGAAKHGPREVPTRSKDGIKRNVEEEPQHHWRQPSPRKQWVPSAQMLRIAAPKPGRTYTEKFVARAEAEVTLKHLLSPQRVYDNNEESRRSLRMKKMSKTRRPDGPKGGSKEARAQQGSGRSSPSMSAGLLYPAMQWQQAVASAEQAGHPSPGGAALAIAKAWGVTAMASEAKQQPSRTSAEEHKDSLRRTLSAPDLEVLVSSLAVPPSESPGITHFNVDAKLIETDSPPQGSNWSGSRADVIEDKGREVPDGTEISTRLFHDKRRDTSSMNEGEQEDRPDPVGVFEIKVFCNPDSSNAASMPALRAFFSRWKQACGWSTPAAMVLNEVRPYYSDA